MTANEVSQQIRNEATAMLDGGLRALLSEYGEVQVIGSYLLDLMTWRDISFVRM